MPQYAGSNLKCVRSERVVFSNLGFKVEDGDALVLIGPNGSGKSSLLRLLAGLLLPAEGTLTWDGEAMVDDMDAHHARMHYVGHLDAVKPVLTVSENISFWSRMRGHGKDTSENAVGDALDTFAISRLADVPGRFLSAGQKRRVTLARLKASPAALWLLDEPTTALDKDAIAALENLIRDHRASGGMVVVSTHAEIKLENATVLDLSRFSQRRAA
ncbi:MAG: heme ABC exporter ATP-binding protein CcmA [Rhodospirillales bacterium]|nr:heme ABC exporter ATP-binding protein CcmA [Rhodospirillales bacterium]